MPNPADRPPSIERAARDAIMHHVEFLHSVAGDSTAPRGERLQAIELLARLARLDGAAPLGGAAGKGAAKSAGRTAGKSAGKTAGKSATKHAAKSAAKGSAKQAAKGAAKRVERGDPRRLVQPGDRKALPGSHKALPPGGS